MLDVDEVTGLIVDAAFKIHSRLGPGLLESAYEKMLVAKLRTAGLQVEQQKTVSFELDGVNYDAGFRIDLFVDDRVIVELKSIEELAPVHSKQVLTYLRLLNLPVGLLINFGGATLKEGVQRIVNRYLPTTESTDRLPIPGKSLNTLGETSL